MAYILLALTAAIAAGYSLGGDGFSPGSSLHVLDLVLALFVYVLLVQPVTTLLHELGHAIAAARLTDRPALVIVGRGPWVSTKWGRVTVRFSLVPRPVRTQRGLAVYDQSDLPWRSIGWISLAGPIATGVTLAAVVAGAPGLWTAGVLARYITFWTVAMLSADLVVNLNPRKPQAQPATVGVPDGWRARHAFECHKNGLAPPSRRPPPPEAASDSHPDPERTATSIPPPA